MPIDREKAVGADLGERSSGWEVDDVILYHLGIGAGSPPTDAGELHYTYEKGLHVLPSFVVVAGGRRPSSGGGGFDIPGVEFNLAQLLHGEQEIEIHKPLPTAAETRTRGRVADVCRRKGCWTILRDGDTQVRVRFKGYSFFVPTDSQGREARKASFSALNTNCPPSSSATKRQFRTYSGRSW